MLYEQIDKDYLAAYKAHQNDKVGVLRLLKAAVKNRLVELKRPGGTLDDAEMLDVIIKQAKQRQDSMEQYKACNRPDLADKEALELEILSAYLPKHLSTAELNEAIAAAIAETGASSAREMGKVISLIMGKYKGQVDGKEVSAMVKQALSK